MDTYELIKKLSDTELGKRINSLNDMFEDLERKQAVFCSSFNVHCKAGCGSCCTCFVPDLSRSEAEYLAFGLSCEGWVQEGIELLDNLDEDPKGCPFYKSDTPFHCSVYRWRPLVCRLFGASASKDKNGRAVFRHCKWNRVAEEVSTFELESKRENVVFMGDFGTQLENIDINDSEAQTLPLALKKALFEVDMTLRLVHQQNGSDSDPDFTQPPESSPTAS